MSIRRPSPSGCVGRRLVWLLDLAVGGSTLRYAEESLEAPGLSGEDVLYSGGLVAPDYTDEVGLFGAGPPSRSASVSVAAESSEFSLEGMWARAARLEGSQAILRLWVEGTGQYAVWLDGVAQNVSCAGPEAPLDFTISEDPADDAGLLPASPTARVSISTWSTYQTRVEGMWYPRVYGSPGGVFSGSSVRYATPGLLVDTVGDGGGIGGYVLLSEGKVKATAVRLKDLATGAEEDCTVLPMRDAARQLVSVAALNTAGNILTHADYTAEAAEIWVSWRTASLGNQQGLDGVHGAGKILRHVLEGSTLRVDWGRVATVAGSLDSLSVDVGISVNEPMSPWQWVAQEILPLQPVGVGLGPDGLYLTLWRSWATPAEAEAHLRVAGWDGETWDAGNAEMEGEMSFSGSGDVKNDLTLDFQYVGHDSRYMARLRATGDPSVVALDADAELNPMCQESRNRYTVRGQPVTKSQESKLNSVWDPQTAAAVLASMAKTSCLPSVSSSYSVGPDFAHLSPGSVVLLTHAAMGIQGIVALVERVTWRATGALSLSIRWSPPPR